MANNEKIQQLQHIDHQLAKLLEQRVQLTREFSTQEKSVDLSFLEEVSDENRTQIMEIFTLLNKPSSPKRTLLVSRDAQPESTIITSKGRSLGRTPQIIAGPCSVESEEQVMAVAEVLQEQGIKWMRGGAFKPRTSPYDFQGLGKRGLEILRLAGDQYDLRVISEVMHPADLEMAAEYLDVIQIGARNMQNFDLLKAAGKVQKPVLLKRGLSATLEEYLYAAEYILDAGNSEVILCERGIRTYEKWTRNTLDISAVPILKQETHLPVLVDITHSTGRKDLLLPMGRAALAAGADGIMLEVHPDPAKALSDSKQQINLEEFRHFMEQIRMMNHPSF
ncbi:bifunctional 3-deoxy-7-phosphoheptulonate synthase/chorismate mutase [Risungbinella massiliensis]|uniref:bifunctional 3-deoxy-7-phosphoheptulonate synthase/chorismate mutase n=1 Tax=Risungbinella massiliensis TaxID=1329796 RepID=UPI0005CC8ED4|nr:bifunctional 3-deoxy-7-phosphoheptulonate synthase/chorismate mutase [Risungbinella massiliensis]